MNALPYLFAVAVTILAGGCATQQDTSSPAPAAPQPAIPLAPPPPQAAPASPPVAPELATQPDPSTREGRMAEALSNYETSKKTSPPTKTSAKRGKTPAKPAPAPRR